MRLLRPALLFLGIALVASLLAASTAFADGPVITPAVRLVTTPIPFGVNCGSFQILFTTDFEGTNISFFNDQNQLVRQIRHGSFTGELYNSTDLSKSVPYAGHFNRTFDAASNTVTLTGERFAVNVPGEGTLAIDAGRTVFDAITGAVIDENGQGQPAFNAAVCALLS
jgi:hypothetical protein